MNSFGDKDLVPFGYLQVIIILNFFHQQASQRRRKNQIYGIQDVDGSWSTSEDQITQVAEKYFHDLFTSENPTDMESVLDVVEKRFTTEMNNSLLQTYTAKEVRQALFQMHPSKSSGLDGMSPFFFQKFWNIVGVDVIDAFLFSIKIWAYVA